MAINYAELEQVTFSRETGKELRQLTPEILGRIIAYAWQAVSGRKQGSLQEGDMFGFLLAADLASAPQRIRDALHIEYRVDGSYLEERTRLMIGAQSSEAVGRLNPSHVPPVFKTDTLQASFLLKQSEVDFPDEVAWIRSAIEQVTQPTKQ